MIQELPLNRSCVEAGIPEQFCACLERKGSSFASLKAEQTEQVAALLKEWAEADSGGGKATIDESELLVVSQMVRRTFNSTEVKRDSVLGASNVVKSQVIDPPGPKTLL